MNRAVIKMVKNYYKVLEVPTTATTAEINAGFKRALLKYHPRKTRTPLAQANKELLEACEAFEVLSDLALRSVYDAYGYDTLSSGIQKNSETVFPAYKFRSSPEDVYKKFMLEANPFAFIANNVSTQCIGAVSGYSETGKNWEIDLTPANIEVVVECTLEELFFGCSKQVRYYRLVKENGGGERSKQQVTKDVLIKPGYSEKTELVYKNEGSEKLNGDKGNLIIKIKEKKHKIFERQGDDLHITLKLGLHEALTPEFIEIESLDKTIRSISVAHCISPQYTLTIEDQGMPISSSSQRGSLCVHFEIIFPEKIPEDRLAELKTLLPN